MTYLTGFRMDARAALHKRFEAMLGWFGYAESQAGPELAELLNDAQRLTREETAACLFAAVAMGEWALDVAARRWWEKSHGLRSDSEWSELRPYIVSTFRAMLCQESSVTGSEEPT